MMDDRRFGAVLFWVMAAAYVVNGVSTFLYGDAGGASAAAYFKAIADHATLYRVEHWSWALANALGILAIGYLVRRARPAGEQLAEGMGRLALVGYGVAVLEAVRFATIVPERAALAITVADPAMLAQLEQQQRAMVIDPRGWFVYGLVGLYWLVIGYMMRRAGGLPRVLPYLAMLGGAASLLVVLDRYFHLGAVGMIATVLGGLLGGPLFCLLFGAHLWRHSHPGRSHGRAA